MLWRFCKHFVPALQRYTFSSAQVVTPKTRIFIVVIWHLFGDQYIVKELESWKIIIRILSSSVGRLRRAAV